MVYSMKATVFLSSMSEYFWGGAMIHLILHPFLAKFRRAFFRQERVHAVLYVLSLGQDLGGQ